MGAAKPRGVLFMAGVVDVEGEGESSATMGWQARDPCVNKQFWRTLRP